MAPSKGRRKFLGGLLAAGVIPRPTWADAGSPSFLSAAAGLDGSYVLCGIGDDLTVRFELPLPARGHAAAAHPMRPEAVAFARRPGTFAVVIDCRNGAQVAMLTSPEGRHFYGHGAFSSDGSVLFTTENDYEAGAGRVGLWDVRNGYRRIGEWDSGGIGPHDIKRLPGSDVLVVANGGIDTHPDSGRTKLNIATMQPNLAYIDSGQVVEVAQLPANMRKNSIRHLAVRGDGMVGFGMQWQGDGHPSALVGVHQRGTTAKLLWADEAETRGMDGYIGSIAFSSAGDRVAVTSPRGGVLQLYDVDAGQLVAATQMEDVCGVATVGRHFAATTGGGEMRRLQGVTSIHKAQTDLMWDNHLVKI
ncbi:MAG: DUF1513 domain-containing protein [Litoreibacter sp.]|uniref:DUF1513 domain-containing protein n=1 Tax=Litoreibacter sp. TaxID=1969459 RepID=UPI0032970351